MKKRKISILGILGAGLILAGVVLLAVHLLQGYAGAGQNQRIIAQLDAILTEKTEGIPGNDPAMPVMELEGKDYVATVQLPDHSVNLPVLDQWDPGSISICPARFYGSVYDHTLVIGGADDPRQFGFCEQVEIGQAVIITDMTGACFTFTVTAVDRARHADTAWLTGQAALTLFCRDQYAAQYIAVRCEPAY